MKATAFPPILSVPRAAEQISLFQSKIKHRRFDDDSFRILESVLVSKDVKSSMEVRSSLGEFMRNEISFVIREIADKTVQQKLSILEFFVCAFALIGDTESCLAFKYEAFSLRDLNSTSDQWLHVSSMEWLKFAEQLLDNGFYAIAIQVCENALLSLQEDNVAEAKTAQSFEKAQILEKLNRVKDHAVKFTASSSVQAQTAQYLKRKVAEKSKSCFSFCKEKQAASTLFRNGIKKRNLRKLLESQMVQQKN